jgi:4-hydroxy-tetrahydrodipicolinate reductase
LLSIEADCVCYAASDWYGPEQVIDDLCRILRSGRDVLDVTMTPLAYPPLLPDAAKLLEEACLAGGSTFYYGGINPGFATDLLPALVASGVRQVESVEITEYFDVSTYMDAILLEKLGFGLTPEAYREQVQIETMAALWSPSPRLVAQAIAGVELDEMRVADTDLRLADRDYQVRTLRVAEGTVEAFHIALDFLVSGRARMIYHEYLRVAPDSSAPWPADWPPPPGGSGGYRIKINGVPTIGVDLSFDPSGPDTARWRADEAPGGALIFTGARVANAIPLVCAAPPGVLTPISLPPNVIGSVRW